jgi:hypothetical protein
MNTRILLLALSVAAFSSCSSVYKSGQTPDDVYFSPARPQADEYVDVKKDEDRYQSYEEYQDNMRNDRFLRMSVGNPYYLNAYNNYDGFDWRYNSYNSYGNTGYYSYHNPWNNYYVWNTFYNPYCDRSYAYYGGLSYGTMGGKLSFSTPISRPISFNRNSYSNNSGSRPSRALSGNYNNVNARYNNSNGSSNRYNYSNSNYSNSTNHSNSNSNYTPSSNNNSNSTPSRSYTPSSSGSSAPASSGSVSRPGRGGR